MLLIHTALGLSCTATRVVQLEYLIFMPCVALFLGRKHAEKPKRSTFPTCIIGIGGANSSRLQYYEVLLLELLPVPGILTGCASVLKTNSLVPSALTWYAASYEMKLLTSFKV